MGLSFAKEIELRKLAHEKYGWDRKQTDKAIGEALKYRTDVDLRKQIPLVKKNLKETEERFKRAEYENQVYKSRQR